MNFQVRRSFLLYHLRLEVFKFVLKYRFSRTPWPTPQCTCFRCTSTIGMRARNATTREPCSPTSSTTAPTDIRPRIAMRMISRLVTRLKILSLFAGGNSLSWNFQDIKCWWNAKNGYWKTSTDLPYLIPSDLNSFSSSSISTWQILAMAFRIGSRRFAQVLSGRRRRLQGDAQMVEGRKR